MTWCGALAPPIEKWGKRKDGHGEVLPGNARARSRSRSRRRGCKAPSRRAYLCALLDVPNMLLQGSRELP